MRLRIVIILLFCWLCGAFLNAEPARRDAERPFVVVIDAGHGGTDPGAIGVISREKDLNLAVSLLAGKLIKEAYPDVEVLYTRTTDVFIPLQQRADFVNKSNANLFICVHTNSSPNPAAKGAETFVLGTEKSDKNLDVAMRENAVIKLEADYQTTYHGFDPNSVDSYIMFELMQNQYMDQSLNYASLLQQHFAGILKRGDRGVRQAAFWVLLKSACPSVLVEMGFISNAEEERFLASEKGQEKIAKSICTAFGSFYKKVTGLKVDTAEPLKLNKGVNPVSKADTVVSAKQEKAVASVVKTDTVTPASNAAAPLEGQETKVKGNKTAAGPLYGVQIFASHEVIPIGDPRFDGLKDCNYIKIGEWYKYYYGATSDRDEAFRLQQQLKERFPGCFVIKL